MPGRSILRALAYRNFRLFFIGQSLSLIGTWTQSTAMPWLVAVLTGSPALTGQVGFFAQLPSFFLSPFAGLVTEHANRRRLLIVTQTLAMIQALILAALVMTGHVQIWQLVALSATLNAINAFDMTARQTFLADMLEHREDLANAIALNSAMVNGSRLFGPALAAALIASVGIAVCFLINGLSFVAVLIAILAMRMHPVAKPAHRPPPLRGLVDGFRYAAFTAPIRATLLLVGLSSLAGLPYATLLPFYASEVLHGDATTYGWLMTAPGVGAFLAGVLMAFLGLRKVLTRLAVAPVVAGACLMMFAAKPNLPGALALLLVSGFAFLTLLNSCNTLIQAVVANDKRGRVMSLYTMMFLGVTPLGSAMVGYLAERLSVVGAMQVCGVLCAAGGVIFALRVPFFRADVERMLTGPCPPTESAAFPVRGGDMEDSQPLPTPQDPARFAPAADASK
jgi:MFS family permease